MSGYQVRDEQLTDTQRADLHNLFALTRELKRKANERRAAGVLPRGACGGQ